ncbi:rhomboid family intramembrane serine protease [Flavobacterium sp. PLA-1-15]|uniref:rhomboid family intramembrane serine protease n=1 Tax=Flavobacterium sp. PLA-1-15 TaxID=3380533 RepID=UPI003B7BAA90
MMNITPTVKQLLIINIIFFIGSQVVGRPAYDLLSLYFFENDKFQVWQPLTHMFMHAALPNFMHILFNMFALYSFGSALEHFWGGKKFLFFYISCGLGAALLHTGINYYEFNSGLQTLTEAGFLKSDIYSLLTDGKIDTRWVEVLGQSGLDSFASGFATPAVGASGAIYGLLVAFAFMFPNAELALMFIPIPIKAKYFVPGILAVDLFLGLKGGSIFGSTSGIAHFAHIGGALTGFLMMWYWKKNQFNRNRWN